MPKPSKLEEELKIKRGGGKRPQLPDKVPGYKPPGRPGRTGPKPGGPAPQRPGSPGRPGRTGPKPGGPGRRPGGPGPKPPRTGKQDIKSSQQRAQKRAANKNRRSKK